MTARTATPRNPSSAITRSGLRFLRCPSSALTMGVPLPIAALSRRGGDDVAARTHTVADPQLRQAHGDTGSFTDKYIAPRAGHREEDGRETTSWKGHRRDSATERYVQRRCGTREVRHPRHTSSSSRVRRPKAPAGGWRSPRTRSPDRGRSPIADPPHPGSRRGRRRRTRATAPRRIRRTRGFPTRPQHRLRVRIRGQQQGVDHPRPRCLRQHHLTGGVRRESRSSVAHVRLAEVVTPEPRRNRRRGKSGQHETSAEKTQTPPHPGTPNGLRVERHEEHRRPHRIERVPVGRARQCSARTGGSRYHRDRADPGNGADDKGRNCLRVIQMPISVATVITAAAIINTAPARGRRSRRTSRPAVAPGTMNQVHPTVPEGCCGSACRGSHVRLRRNPPMDGRLLRSVRRRTHRP